MILYRKYVGGKLDAISCSTLTGSSITCSILAVKLGYNKYDNANEGVTSSNI